MLGVEYVSQVNNESLFLSYKLDCVVLLQITSKMQLIRCKRVHSRIGMILFRNHDYLVSVVSLEDREPIFLCLSSDISSRRISVKTNCYNSRNRDASLTRTRIYTQIYLLVQLHVLIYIRHTLKPMISMYCM